MYNKATRISEAFKTIPETSRPNCKVLETNPQRRSINEKTAGLKLLSPRGVDTAG